ncbi:actin-related protein 2/3 complex subunit 5 [Sphaerosporella brunnea]|uniref:Actin-related protein 2/3 complex subunit 5 n=1 Tax=Sphaerosporella brunnea TaxID=1250544 RepID=A0A5J5EVK1_9PEZI|nr:actin-related protein 2/3 complex subunit 5 [Sphaerosporella brunnea]
MATGNWRLIDVDALDPENAFPAELLTPQFAPVPLADIQALANHCRQSLQRGEQEEALLTALKNVPYGGDDQGKELHLATILEILSSIKQAEMTPILARIYSSPNGTELLDALMKYLYKGMARHNASNNGTPGVSVHATGASSVSGFGGATREFGVAPSRGDGGGMSVLLSWHEKVVDVAGTGAIVRVMTDRRTV